MAATLPTSDVDVSLPWTLGSPPGTVRNVDADHAGVLQDAITAASAGDEIELTAGSTYTGTFNILNSIADGTNWIIIRTSAYASLPELGNTRVHPSDASNMAKIETNAISSTPLFLVDRSAGKVRFIGIEFSNTNTDTTDQGSQLLIVGRTTGGSNPGQESELVDGCIVDRCYLHGTTVGNQREGILVFAKNFALIHSYVDDIHRNTGIGSDVQCVTIFLGSGPHLIDNNELRGSDEAIFAGDNGSLGGTAWKIPSNITITRNYVHVPTDAYFDTFEFKNLLEFKDGAKILIEGNWFERSSDVGAQDGTAILPGSVRGQDDIVDDVTIRFNVFNNSHKGIKTNTDSLNTGSTMNRFDCHDNLFTEIRDWFFELNAAGGTESNVDFNITHNTCIGVAAGDMSFRVLLWASSTIAIKGFIFKDNICQDKNTAGQNEGMLRAGKQPGFDSFTNATSGTSEVNNNIFIDGRADKWDTDVDFGDRTTFGHELIGIGTVGFEGDSNPVTVADHALKSGGTYSFDGAKPATDSKDMGADIATLLDKIDGAKSGVWAPGDPTQADLLPLRGLIG